MLLVDIDWTELKKYEVIQELLVSKPVPNAKCLSCHHDTVEQEPELTTKVEHFYQFGDTKIIRSRLNGCRPMGTIEQMIWGLEVEWAWPSQSLALHLPVDDMDGFDWKDVEQAIRPLIDQNISFKLISRDYDLQSGYMTSYWR